MADANFPIVPMSGSTARFWTWRKPPATSEAARNPYIVPILRFPVVDSATTSPEDTADDVLTDLAARGLTKPDEVCILLQGYGAVAKATAHCVLCLADDPADTLVDGSNKSVNSVFTSAGRADCLTWTQRFIEEYVGDNRAVAPIRFHMDFEEPPAPYGLTDQNGNVIDNRYYIVGNTDWSLNREPWNVQIGTLGDTRCDTELLYGTSGSDLSSLWDDANLSVAVDSAWSVAANRPFSMWYMGVCLRVAERCLAESLYEPVKAEPSWAAAGIQCSNYGTSLRSSAAWPEYNGGNTDWFIYHHDAEADTQAPACYPIGPLWGDLWANFITTDKDGWFHHSRLNLLAGFYTAPSIPLTPWILNVGGQREVVEDVFITATFADVYRLVTFAWQLGAREFLMFDNTESTVDDWNALSKLAYRLAYETSPRNRLRMRRR